MTALAPDRQIFLSDGRRCVLRSRPMPWLPNYHVFFLPESDGPPTPEQESEFFGLAPGVAEDLGQRFYGDRGCFTLLLSGARTRRRPWPHVHLLPARDVAEKRRALLLLYCKRVLRWFQRSRR